MITPFEILDITGLPRSIMVGIGREFARSRGIPACRRQRPQTREYESSLRSIQRRPRAAAGTRICKLAT
jgi:hypothetical protein